MGGNVALGYNVKERKLVANQADALTVRMIFQRYAELGSVALLKAELERAGIVSKRREGAGRQLSGGKRFFRGALFLMLQNRLYRGEVAHNEKIYLGQHEAIIEPELWQAVQDKLAAGRRERSMAVGAEAPSLLSSLIVDANGTRLSLTHAVMKGKRYHYYVSTALISGSRSEHPKGWRIPAGDIEELVLDRLRALFASGEEIGDAIVPLSLPRPNEPYSTDRQSWRSAGQRLQHSSFANSSVPWSSRSRLTSCKSWYGSIEPQSYRASCPTLLPSQQIACRLSNLWPYLLPQAFAGQEKGYGW